MRINKFVATASGLSRRKADELISNGAVHINGRVSGTGEQVTETDAVTLHGKPIVLPQISTTIMLNKPAGYVCSRKGQGSQTIYDLLPIEYHRLKPVGRLDKDSSGLILLTDDGELAQRLLHPSHDKDKRYELTLDRALTPADKATVIETGVNIGDARLSRFELSGQGTNWRATLSEGRNRQIRRTFAALGYTVIALHRSKFDSYELGDLRSACYRLIGA